tara:strand:+ start:153 stop:749 length:597 start_codon:yes stop_codon:yes gene_type:complete
MANEVFNLFPSSVHLMDIENYDVVKEEALSFIYQEQENNPSSVYKSNRGGWQSDSDYHEWNNIIKRIVDKGLSKHSEFYLDYRKLEYHALWFNINKKGNYNHQHDHPRCDLSGVLWIKTPPNCGKIKFESSHSYVANAHLSSLNEKYKYDTHNYTQFNFNTVEGRMLIFPSYLRHSVEVNESDEDRISVSFNLSIVNR